MGIAPLKEDPHKIIVVFKKIGMGGCPRRSAIVGPRHVERGEAAFFSAKIAGHHVITIESMKQ